LQRIKSKRNTPLSLHFLRPNYQFLTTNKPTLYLYFAAQLSKMRKSIILKRGKENALARKHPWIFSGAIFQTDKSIQDGDLTDVFDSTGNWLCCGHYSGGSIAVRVLSWDQKENPEAPEFWVKRFQDAWALRIMMHVNNAETNCFRWVHGEGDQLSSLIVDVYGEVAVVQCHSIGMFRQIDLIAQSLMQSADGTITTVYNKSKEALPKQMAEQMENGFLIGSSVADVVTENGINFRVDWVGGQKTGFFLDQRDNRKLLGELAFGKSVLNTFCYTGGFSIAALKAGATGVASVDVSAKAIALTDENVSLNGDIANRHQTICSDVLHFFKAHPKAYDIVVVDPPAFAKSLDKRHNAVQGYKRLNMSAMSVLKPGGLLLTFSCSQVVDRDLFQNTIVAALLEAGREAQILKVLSQGPDHPVSASHPEGHYLKGLLLRVY
jgi:23S rRNA (cytosine1962-C5)-methyltransferase